MEPEGVEPSRRGVQGRPVARNSIPGASLSADGESRTPTGLLPHGSEPRLSTCSKHVRKLSRVGRPGIEPGSPGLQPGAWTVLSYRSIERPGRDSNPRLRGCSPADAPLSYLAEAIPGEGFEPDSSLGSEPSVLPIRRSRSVEKSVSSRSRIQLQFPLSRRRRASRAVSPARSPTADRARSSPAPARLAALCESSPAAPGFTRIAHRGLEPRISPTWEGLQNNEGDPRVALIAAPGVSNRVRSLTAVLRRGVAQHRPHSSMQPPRCIHIRRAIDRFVADVWLMFSHGSNEKGGPCGPPSTRFLVWA